MHADCKTRLGQMGNDFQRIRQLVGSRWDLPVELYLEQHVISRMNRVLSGLIPAAVVVLLVALGLWAMVDTYVVESATTYLLPSVGVLVVAFAFVFVLFVLGARSDSWIRSPYW